MELHPTDKKIEEAVIQVLEDILGVPGVTLLLTDDFRDLNANPDDLSYVFVPELERRLGIKPDLHEWPKAFTIRDVIDLFKRVRDQR